MKILESQSATLTNAEVLSHLLSLSAKTRPSSSSTSTPPLKSPNFETIRASLLEYLSPPHSSTAQTTSTSPTTQTTSPSSPNQPTPTNTPSPLPDYTHTAYSAATTRSLLERLRPYDLSKAELLMLANLRPRDLGLLDCVVEECDERFGAGEQEGMLGVVEGEGKGEGEGG